MLPSVRRLHRHPELGYEVRWGRSRPPPRKHAYVRVLRVFVTECWRRSIGTPNQVRRVMLRMVGAVVGALVAGLANSLPSAPTPSPADPLEKLQNLDFASKIKIGLSGLKDLKLDPRKKFDKTMNLPKPNLPNLKKLKELKNSGLPYGKAKEQQKPLTCAPTRQACLRNNGPLGASWQLQSHDIHGAVRWRPTRNSAGCEIYLQPESWAMLTRYVVCFVAVASGERPRASGIRPFRNTDADAQRGVYAGACCSRALLVP